MPPGYFAQTVFASSFLTLLIVGGLALIFRGELVGWISGQLDLSEHSIEQIEQMITVTHDERVTDVVEKANQSVVSVVATRDVPVFERYFETFDPFGGFFGGGGGFTIPRERQRGTEEQQVSGGSGFLVSEDGMIVTNRHVVLDDVARYSVMFADGSLYDVDVLARDVVIDIAILQITDDDFSGTQPFSFGDSDSLRLGQTVIAIGNALAEFTNTVSVGVVSGLSRTISARGPGGMIEQLDQVIQTDAAINLGNSGGPLLDMSGNVVGVNVAASLVGENIGFAIPANMVAQIVSSVQETGEIVRPFLGVRYMTLSPQVAESEGIGITYGALVIKGDADDPDGFAVVPGSAADEAGLQAGDVIISINGRSLEGVSLAQVLRASAVGDEVSLRVWRDGKELKMKAVLQAAP